MGWEHHETKISELMAQFARAQEARREPISEGAGVIGYGQEAFSDPRRAPKHRTTSRSIKHEPDSEIDGLEVSEVWSTQRSSISSKTSMGDARADLEDDRPVPTSKKRDDSTTPPSSPEPPQPIDMCMPPPDCECPIDLECRVKGGHLIDCRRLVPLSRQWAARQRHYDPLDMAEDQEEEGPYFAALNQIVDILEPLQQLAAVGPNTVATRTLLANINVWIHIMQTMPVTENDVAASGVVPALEAFLHADNDDMRRAKRFPPATFDHLLAILRKWQHGDYGVRPHRGFNGVGNRWVRDPNWQLGRDGRFYGEGHLVNGQRFADRRQLCLEGGHAATVAGIAGTAAGGAYSVVMGLHFPETSYVYADVDCGETIYYMSTALKQIPGERPSNFHDPDDEDNPADPDTATRGAKALLRSHETSTPVRVFRSWCASQIVPLRPQRGLRYDGLYTVVDYGLLKNRRQIYRFEMVRVRGQNPIHGTVDVAGQRSALKAGRGKQERPRVKAKRRSENNKTGGSGAGARTTKRQRTE